MTTKKPVADPFAEEEEFNKRAKSIAPNEYSVGSSKFASFNKLATMFILMPRAEKPESFSLPLLMHHGLWEPAKDTGEPRRTARICLEASGKGPCAVCHAMKKLKGSRRPEDLKLLQGLEPKLRTLATVWFLPLSLVIGNPISRHVFNFMSFDSRRQFGFEVTESPMMRVLGFPKRVWANTQGIVRLSGAEKLVGTDGTPLYVVANGEEGKARRYKEPKLLEVDLPDELRPPADVEPINLEEVADFPTPAEVAALVDMNFTTLRLMEDFNVDG